MTINKKRQVWIDHLRAFLTVLVVAHHAALAYTSFSFFDPKAYIRSTHPVVDGNRWVALDYFVGANDSFFMPLLFLISGLFFYTALSRKGHKKFLTDRARRLGLPFLFAICLLIPIAYIPAWLIIHHSFDLTDFLTDYLTTEQWPVGPPWFIWLLLTFNFLACLFPSFLYLRVSRWIAKQSARPGRLVAVFIISIGIAYISLTSLFGPYCWTGIGPFDFQLNRVGLYFVSFMIGGFLGSGDWEKSLFYKDRLLGASWIAWALITGICFYLHARYSNAGYGVFFVLACAAGCLAFLAIFRSNSNRLSKCWQSLSSNAFGIYLVHYGFVTWLQFALLNVSIPPPLKFLIVFFFALAGSWIVSRFFNRLMKKATSQMFRRAIVNEREHVTKGNVTD